MVACISSFIYISEPKFILPRCASVAVTVSASTTLDEITSRSMGEARCAVHWPLHRGKLRNQRRHLLKKMMRAVAAIPGIMRPGDISERLVGMLRQDLNLRIIYTRHKFAELGSTPI